MIFSSILPLFLSAIVILQVAIRVGATYVDDVVADCIRKENIFAAREYKYTHKSPPPPNTPAMFPRQFKEEQTKAYEFERSQRSFECIADTLSVYSDQYLKTSHRYCNLVQECRCIQLKTPRCNPSYKYRMINGTCNNLFHPKWGSTLSCFRRRWRANYEGVSGLRKSVVGKKPLPNARDISRALVKPVSRPTTDFNTLFVFFGQSIAHDIAQFTFFIVYGTELLDCCSKSTGKDQHPQCAPIYLKPTDHFYYAQNVSCFAFSRLAACSTCSVEKRVPLNYLTAYIDCSFVYGQTYDIAQELRRNDGSGKLKVQYSESCELFLPDPRSGSFCGDAVKQEFCFKSGDTRTDQTTPLMILYTLILREHNRIATKLKNMNPLWDEETLYQESRSIVIAEWQAITYAEFLPIILGPELMLTYELNFGVGSTYNGFIDLSPSVEFNVASFRMHSIIPGQVVFDDVFVLLRDLYFNSKPLYHDETSAYLSAMAESPGEKYDRFMTIDITLFLYKRLPGTYGFDLAAIDIQRGRDAGVPTYPQVIEYLEKKPGAIRTFDDLSPYITHECQIILQKLYSDVRDIDFIVGIICEKIPQGMIISPTAAKIIAEQFGRQKFGDRFYVEHHPTFTVEQRETFKRASLARMICDNTKVTEFQPKAMLLPSSSNPRLPCSDIPGVDLEKWRA